MACLIGIDSGLTVTKVVVFDENGAPLAVVRRRVRPVMERPRHVERDMAAHWQATAEAIAEAVAGCGRPAGDIAAIGATAHGDGLYLLDRDRGPLGNGILSLDSRAGGIVAGWAGDGTAARALDLTGQVPHASAPSALLAWIRDHEPDRFARIAHVLACKDWIRFCLTETVGTDFTEASTSFTAVRSQVYDPAIASLYGLDAVAGSLPPVAAPNEVVGHVTAAVARRTGLRAGTPVVAGLHDVTASALGVGGYRPGTIAVIAGTYSINETVAHEPRIDARWFCRNGLRPGEWNHMAISPASATNYDWFLDTFWQSERKAAEEAGRSIHDAVARELAPALGRPSAPFFHPYLFGSPHGPAASAGFLGLRGWHDRADMARAVVEGIVFNHRVHIDGLRSAFEAQSVRLTGGISRNGDIAGLFADGLSLPVSVSAVEEPAAWGAALCAGAGVGLFGDPTADPRAGRTTVAVFAPRPERAALLEARYRLHCDIACELEGVWSRIEALAGSAPSAGAGSVEP